MIMSEEAYKNYPHHLDYPLEGTEGFGWVRRQRLEVTSKVAFFNSCGIFKRILFSLLHGRNFRPTANEINLYNYYKQLEQK